MKHSGNTFVQAFLLLQCYCCRPSTQATLIWLIKYVFEKNEILARFTSYMSKARIFPLLVNILNELKFSENGKITYKVQTSWMISHFYEWRILWATGWRDQRCPIWWQEIWMILFIKLSCSSQQVAQRMYLMLSDTDSHIRYIFVD